MIGTQPFVIGCMQIELFQATGVVRFTSLEDASKSLELTLPDTSISEESAADAGLCFSLPIAMREGKSMASNIPVDAILLKKAKIISDLISTWLPALRPVSLPRQRATELEKKKSPLWQVPERGGAVLFSGGLHSFYSAMQLVEHCSTAIYLPEFDGEFDGAEDQSERVRHAAEALGLKLIVIGSNARSLCDSALPWSIYQGAVIAGIGHLLADQFERLYIPTSRTFLCQDPGGMHPLLVPLWSSERIDFVLHAAGTHPVDKARELAESDIARRHVILCGKSPACGQCAKCARAATLMTIAGADGLIGNFFPHAFPLDEQLLILENDVEESIRMLDTVIDAPPRIAIPGPLLEKLKQAHARMLGRALMGELALHASDYFQSPAWRKKAIRKLKGSLLADMTTSDPEWLLDHLPMSDEEYFDLLWTHDRKWLSQSIRKRKA